MIDLVLAAIAGALFAHFVYHAGHDSGYAEGFSDAAAHFGAEVDE